MPRRSLTERLPGIAVPHARRTERVRGWLLWLAVAVGGEPGARVLSRPLIAVCGDTVLAQVRSYQMPDLPVSHMLSRDGFAFRRGRTGDRSTWSEANSQLGVMVDSARSRARLLTKPSRK